MKILFLAILIALSPSAFSSIGKTVNYYNNDLNKQEIGEWWFYPGELITSSKEAKGDGELVAIPHTFEPDVKIGTYITNISFRHYDATAIGININRSRFSLALFVDGYEIGKQGQPGETNDLTVHEYVPLTTPILVINKDDYSSDILTVEVAIQTASFFELPSGINGPIFVGEYQELLHTKTISSIANISTAIIALILAILLSISYYYSNDISQLALALSGLALCIRQLAIDHEYLRNIFYFLSEKTIIAVDYSTAYYLTAFFTLFVLSSLKTEVQRYRGNEPLNRILVFIIITSIFFASVMVTTQNLKWLHIGLSFIPIALVVLIFALLKLITERRKTSVLASASLWFSIITLPAAAIWDIAIVFDFLNGQLISTYAFMMLLFLKMLINFTESKERAVLFEKLQNIYEEENEEKENFINHLYAVNESMHKSIEETFKKSEETMQNLCRELHDSLSNVMTETASTLSQSKDMIASSHKEVSERLGKAEEALKSSYNVFRSLINNDRPTNLEYITLRKIIERGLLVPKSVLSSIKIDDDTSRLDQDSKVHIFRICQEAATNMIKHSDATLFQIDITSERVNGIDGWAIKILDNGIGVDLDKVKLNGVENIKYRFKIMGGRLAIHTCIGAGFIYDGWIPKAGNTEKSISEILSDFNSD